MALAKCRECGQSVSDKALACPHCGAPNPVAVTNKPAAPGNRELIFTAVVALAGMVFVIKACDTGPGTPAAGGAQKSSDLGASARHVCRQFIGQRGYKVDDWGEQHAWATVANTDGSYSVGARIFGAAPGDVSRNIYLSCVVTNLSLIHI